MTVTRHLQMFVHVLSHRHQVAARTAEQAFHKSETAFAGVLEDTLALEPHAALARTRHHFFRAHVIVAGQPVGAHRGPATIMRARH